MPLELDADAYRKIVAPLIATLAAAVAAAAAVYLLLGVGYACWA